MTADKTGAKADRHIAKKVMIDFMIRLKMPHSHLKSKPQLAIIYIK